MSGWSAFTLGMKRPELTVLAIGEWDRPTGGTDWGVAIRDLRTGNERLVFNEQEWERIKRNGLPPVGVDWGESVSSITVSPGVETLIESERVLFQATQPSGGNASHVPAEATDWGMPEIIGYLDFDLGEELAKDENFTPFAREEINAIGEAIRRGTPEDVRYSIKPDEGQPSLDALTEWLRDQRRLGHTGASPRLKAILDGKLDIDLSGPDPQFRGHE